MRDESVVTGLVTRARHGDQHAWDALVERYAPLVWSICRSYRLSRADADDVGQTVWLHLLADLGKLRDPAALAGWIATTTRRECGKACRAARPARAATWQTDPGDLPDTAAEPAESRLLAAERHAALRQAFTCPPPGCQQLLACSSKTRRSPTPRSAPGSASPPGASGPPAAAACTSCAATRPSPP
jgi:RNA polymerase sigma factor (sigma-70 family)